MNQNLSAKIPPQCGVYMFVDRKKRPLYVGKALNLKKRIASYFREENEKSEKIQRLLHQTDRIKTYLADSEVEALLREAELIKKFNPPFNVRLKDDKSYQFIRITGMDFPRLEKIHAFSIKNLPLEKKSKDLFFGPYPLGNVVQILSSLRRLFPFRDCSPAKFYRQHRLEKPCLYGNIRLCPAPCVGTISQDLYRMHIKSIVAFLKGRKKRLLSSLQKAMVGAARQQNFEQAAFLRDQWQRLKTVISSSGSGREEFSIGLGKVGNYQVSALMARLEAYDISHHHGQSAVGSLAVFVKGQPEKNSYRRFRIQTDKTFDDYRMLGEVLRRRFTNKNLDRPPGAILVDGGRGQIAVAQGVLQELNLKIPLYALAKKEETLYHSEDGQSKVVRLNLPRHSPLLHLFQRMRDEAHRFALSYHHHLRRL